MGKRIQACDVLGEIRKALRALRRAERFLVATERKERARDKAGKQRADAGTSEAIERGNRKLRYLTSEGNLTSEGAKILDRYESVNPLDAAPVRPVKKSGTQAAPRASAQSEQMKG